MTHDDQSRSMKNLMKCEKNSEHSPHNSNDHDDRDHRAFQSHPKSFDLQGLPAPSASAGDETQALHCLHLPRFALFLFHQVHSDNFRIF